MSESFLDIEVASENETLPATYSQVGRLNQLVLLPLALNFQMGVRENAPPLVVTKKVAHEILSMAKDQGLW